jgi:hypothetical protein
MSEITDKTDELFMAAWRSDDDLGYPADVAFVPSDEEWTDDVLWRNLIEGQATVLVGEDTELLLVLLRRGVIDRLRDVCLSASRPERMGTPRPTRR